MTPSDLDEILTTLGTRQIMAMTDLFEALVVALDQRGALSKRQIVTVLEDAIPCLEEIGNRDLSIDVFRRVIRDLGGNHAPPSQDGAWWLRGVIDGGKTD